jgi:hypothetical protein
MTTNPTTTTASQILEAHGFPIYKVQGNRIELVCSCTSLDAAMFLRRHGFPTAARIYVSTEGEMVEVG